LYFVAKKPLSKLPWLQQGLKKPNLFEKQMSFSSKQKKDSLVSITHSLLTVYTSMTERQSHQTEKARKTSAPSVLLSKRFVCMISFASHKHPRRQELFPFCPKENWESPTENEGEHKPGSWSSRYTSLTRSLHCLILFDSPLGPGSSHLLRSNLHTLAYFKGMRPLPSCSPWAKIMCHLKSLEELLINTRTQSARWTFLGCHQTTNVLQSTGLGPEILPLPDTIVLMLHMSFGLIPSPLFICPLDKWPVALAVTQMKLLNS
jgi:inorganic triphosphatase YgiF